MLPGTGLTSKAQGRRYRLRQNLSLVGLSRICSGVGTQGKGIPAPARGAGGCNAAHDFRAKDSFQLIAGEALQFTRLLQLPRQISTKEGGDHRLAGGSDRVTARAAGGIGTNELHGSREGQSRFLDPDERLVHDAKRQCGECGKGAIRQAGNELYRARGQH